MRFVNSIGERNIFRRFFMRKKFYKGISDTCIGDGLNEGFTVWLTEKLIGTSMSKGAYTLEKIYVETIADIKGDKEALKIAKGDYEELAEMLNMEIHDFFFFLKCLDIVSKEVNEMDVKNSSEEIQMAIDTYNVFQSGAQGIFFRCFVFPEFEGRMLNEGITVKNLELLCYITSNFKNINEASKFWGCRNKPDGEETYKALENFLKAHCIDFSHDSKLEEYSDDEIITIHSIFDFVFDMLR